MLAHADTFLFEIKEPWNQVKLLVQPFSCSCWSHSPADISLKTMTFPPEQVFLCQSLVWSPPFTHCMPDAAHFTVWWLAFQPDGVDILIFPVSAPPNFIHGSGGRAVEFTKHGSGLLRMTSCSCQRPEWRSRNSSFREKRRQRGAEFDELGVFPRQILSAKQVNVHCFCCTTMNELSGSISPSKWKRKDARKNSVRK